MVTNLKRHFCNVTPRMAFIDWDKNIFGEGSFILTLQQRKTEGKLQPKVYTIKVPITYCPFCGEQLKQKAHLESCNCSLCEFDKAQRMVKME